MHEELSTPCILIEAPIVRRNLAAMASYAASRGLRLRPHTKTHKSARLAKMQLDHGAAGLTVAKAGEAQVMAQVCDDLLMAYPAVDSGRCDAIADLARSRTLRVGIDSSFAADRLAEAARSAGSTIGILVDLDVGHHRTGVQTAQEALILARHISRRGGLRLDGLMFFPGHISTPPAVQEAALIAVDQKLAEVLSLWRADGLEAHIVSGGSTPTASQAHAMQSLTEIRPGTYIFNDMNCVHGGSAALEDCAATVLATVVSTAVAGQVVLDCGSKTLTSDRCGPAPESGHGHIIDYAAARIVKLSEEHAQVDITHCERVPKIGQRVRVVPNHICPCVNLQDNIWWLEPGERPEMLCVDARGKVF